jgi:N6-adenosine-specific RNA methylase IME4
MSSSNFIEAVVEGPEEEVEEESGLFTQQIMRIKVPITGGKYADKVYELTKPQYETLKQSIKINGFLPKYPILINRQGDILDGHHRLKACIELGDGIKQWRPTFQLQEGFANEIEEELFAININRARRQLTKFQDVELALKAESLLALTEQARKNMKAGVTLSRQQERVHVDEKIAKDSKTSKDTVYKVRKIINSPIFKENEDFREKARADKIKIENAYTQVMRAADRNIPKPKPPEGQYDVLLIDPPWDYSNSAVRGSPEDHYSVMTDEEIKQLKIPAADKAAVLFLWATNPKLDIAIDVMSAWGFTYKTNIAWVKDKYGTGYYVRGQHELLLIGIKGSGLGTPAEADRPSSKPLEVYDLIEKMFPGRKYLEMFARGDKPRNGWKTWGLEAAAE